ncbi:hypothetical protein HZH68_003838 [Vespula germanica]|uniref:Uncharacterized protein n=1 Tax=Vespula germanica TaxID=30212 RepID=A0A834NHF6_VESGE|nr:hypothetical protein HZH68_003838 [Vespula germanica]
MKDRLCRSELWTSLAFFGQDDFGRAKEIEEDEEEKEKEKEEEEEEKKEKKRWLVRFDVVFANEISHYSRVNGGKSGFRRICSQNRYFP